MINCIKNKQIMKVTMLWFDNLKGIGEGYDENGVIHFINAWNTTFSIMFPEKNQTIYIKGK